MHSNDTAPLGDEERERGIQCFYTQMNGVSHAELTVLAYQILMDNLRRYGNNPCEEHCAALFELVGSYTFMAQKFLTGRHVFPLATGLGKTQSIVAWLSAIHQLGYRHISVAVCANKVEALCDLKRDLISQGIPGDQIGLFHSYKFDESAARKYLEGNSPLESGYASLPSTSDHEQKQILLVTHNRVRGGSGIEQFNLYQGKPRDLLIWDESLLISETRALIDTDLRSGIGYLKPRVRGNERLKEALDYLDECMHVLDLELDRQKVEGKAPEAVRLPERTPREILEYKLALSGSGPHGRESSDPSVIKPLQAFLEISQDSLRIATTQQDDGVITYDIVVPPELENIIILDASHPIRELVRLDKSIQYRTQVGRFSENIISYENVTVHQLRHASGRSTMTNIFQAKRREDRTVCLEIAEVVKQIPQEQGIILFTFKPRGIDFRKVLERELRGSGIDLEATVKVQTWKDGVEVIEERQRFVWLTCIFRLKPDSDFA